MRCAPCIGCCRSSCRVAETTGIAWTTSSWSPWIGCTEVSPGCLNCYARELDKRHRYGGAVHWGVGTPRYRTKDWTKPVSWNKKAAPLAAGERWTVFPSLCDPFDNEVPAEWHADFWRLIRATPYLTWLLLTKRIGNAAKIHPGGEYPNVWIGASVVNQEEADRDIPKLLEVSAAKRFVSYEPALGPVDWRDWLRRSEPILDHGAYAIPENPRLQWVIVGGESTQGAGKTRPFDLAWARSTVAQCKAAGVPVFVKQLGSKPFETFAPGCDHFLNNLSDRAGADPAEWPDDLRVQNWPE